MPYSFISSLLHPQKKIYLINGIDDSLKKRKLNPLSSSQLISSTPACDLAMLPPKLGSRNSGCQRLRCRVASSRAPGSSTAGAAGAAGAAAGAFVGAGTWHFLPPESICHCGQPFAGQLIWCFACYNHDVGWKTHLINHDVRIGQLISNVIKMLDGFYHLYPSVFFWDSNLEMGEVRLPW